MLPTNSTTCGRNENAKRIVAIAPNLASDVVDAGDRPGEHQRQHVLAAIGAHDVGRNQRDEQQQRGRDTDVVAVGDDLDAFGQEAVAGHVADPDVDDRGDRDDAEQRERRDLLPPRPPDAQARGASTPCRARTSPRPAGRAALRTGGSRGRRPRRRPASTTLTTTSSARRRNTSSSDVTPRREAVERELELRDRRCATCRDRRRRRPRLRRHRRPRRRGRFAASSAATSSSPLRTDVDGDGAGALEQRVGRARDDESTARRSSRRSRTPSARRRAGAWPSAPRCRTMPSRATSASMSSRPAGSRPLVGSSSSTSSGSPTIACASFVRWRMPVENSPIGRKRASSSPTRSRMSEARWRAARAGKPAQLAERRRRRRPRSDRAAGSRARACSRAAPARRSDRARRRGRTPRCGPRSDARARAAGGRSSSCPRRSRRRGRCARAAPRCSGRRAPSCPDSASSVRRCGGGIRIPRRPRVCHPHAASPARLILK